MLVEKKRSSFTCRFPDGGEIGARRASVGKFGKNLDDPDILGVGTNYILVVIVRDSPWWRREFLPRGTATKKPLVWIVLMMLLLLLLTHACARLHVNTMRVVIGSPLLICENFFGLIQLRHSSLCFFHIVWILVRMPAICEITFKACILFASFTISTTIFWTASLFLLCLLF